MQNIFPYFFKNIVYYSYNKKKKYGKILYGKKSGHAQNIFPYFFKTFCTTTIDLFILKNMGAAIIDFRVCPPLVKCQNIMFSGFIDTLMYGFSDNMKQPAAILVLQYWYTILVIPVFYQYLPVSVILVQILVNTSIPVSSRIFQYLQY